MEIRGRKINRFCPVHVCISTQLEQTLSLAWFKTEPEAAWVFMAVSLSATAGSFDQQSISVTRVQAATRAHPRTLQLARENTSGDLAASQLIKIACRHEHDQGRWRGRRWRCQEKNNATGPEYQRCLDLQAMFGFRSVVVAEFLWQTSHRSAKPRKCNSHVGQPQRAITFTYHKQHAFLLLLFFVFVLTGSAV